MNRSGIMTTVILVAIGLIAMVVWKPGQPYAGLQFLVPEPQRQTPAPQQQPMPGPREQEPTSQGSAPGEEEPTTYGQTAPAPEIQGQERRPPAKCLDGSALTVTSRDRNQTNYRCSSGRIGAYTN